MSSVSAVLRVKRKRGTDAAEALLLACKRLRPESEAQSAVEATPEPVEVPIENSVFKLVATVPSQDASVRVHLQEALSRPRLAHALRPAASSNLRIARDLRSTKWNIRREERYQVLSSFRPELSNGVDGSNREGERQAVTDVTEGNVNSWLLRDLQVFDIVQQAGEKGPRQGVTPEPDEILCNSVKLIREKLTVSVDSVGSQHREKEDEYVYDLYCQETSTPGWIQDILSVKPYLEENELVPDEDSGEQEVYEDEDDENEEGNWRNDYPDEEGSGEDSDPEERYRGYHDEEEEFGHSSWERYRQQMMRELEEDDYVDEEEEELDS